MATKSTNKTLVIVAVVAIAGYAAWKIVPKLASKLGNSSGGSSSNPVGGGGYTEADENPYGYDSQQQSPLGGLLSALSNLFGGTPGSKSGGSGGGGGGSSYGSGSSSQGTGGTSVLQAALNQIFGDSADADTLANPELGGASLATYDASSSDNDAGVNAGLTDYQIPYQDANATLDLTGTDIPTASGLLGDDSSASDAAINEGYADVLSYGGGNDTIYVQDNDEEASASDGDVPGEDTGAAYDNDDVGDD